MTSSLKIFRMDRYFLDSPFIKVRVELFAPVALILR
jgi:hypothetical protein